jgi:hypothetical protein
MSVRVSPVSHAARGGSVGVTFTVREWPKPPRDRRYFNQFALCLRGRDCNPFAAKHGRPVGGETRRAANADRSIGFMQELFQVFSGANLRYKVILYLYSRCLPEHSHVPLA